MGKGREEGYILGRSWEKDALRERQSTPSPYRLLMVKDSHILESLNPSPWEEGFVGRDIVMRLEVKKNFNSFPLWGRIYREG